MRLIGFAGWSGSGKTTLLAKLLPVLIARGHNVSTVKHAHHSFEIDHPGKDSHTHRLAGAQRRQPTGECEMLGTAVLQRHARHAEVGQERGDEISGGEREC